ncbi:MAG: FitA-like ribbon-helix-helix domain-containing protein [Actinomycetota bacterium]
MSSRGITIRNVPEEVHRELSARAAGRGQSLQEFLLAEFGRLVSRPSATDLIERLRARKAATDARLSSERILAHRDVDRR